QLADRADRLPAERAARAAAPGTDADQPGQRDLPADPGPQDSGRDRGQGDGDGTASGRLQQAGEGRDGEGLSLLVTLRERRSASSDVFLFGTTRGGEQAEISHCGASPIPASPPEPGVRRSSRFDALYPITDF